MVPKIATLVYVVGILWFFKLNRDRGARTSGALWLPVIWLLINGSRTVSQWLADFGLASYSSSTPGQYLEGSPLDRNVYLALTVLALIVLIKRQRATMMLLRANGPILLFFFYCAVSAFWSDFPDVTFKRWTKGVGDLAMILIVLSDSDPMAALKRLFSRVGFVLLPLSMLFIKYYPQLGRSYSNVLGRAAYVGVTTNKNQLGMIVLILGVGSMWCFLQGFLHREDKPGNGLLIAHGALLAIAIWLLWTADSATSTSCFLMAGALMAVTSLYKKGRNPKVVHLLVVGVVSVSLVALFLETGGGLLGAVGREATLTGRTDIWKLVLRLSGNPLLGTGFESFWLGDRLQKTWNVYRFHLNEAHNGYIEIYLTLGWIGVALLAILFLTGYRNVLGAFRRDPSTASLRLAYFVVAVVYNLTESGFRILNPVWFFFFFAIMAAPQAAIQEPAPLTRSDHTDNFTEDVEQHEQVLRTGFGKETI